MANNGELSVVPNTYVFEIYLSLSLHLIFENYVSI